MSVTSQKNIFHYCSHVAWNKCYLEIDVTTAFERKEGSPDLQQYVIVGPQDGKCRITAGPLLFHVAYGYPRGRLYFNLKMENSHQWINCVMCAIRQSYIMEFVIVNRITHSVRHMPKKCVNTKLKIECCQSYAKSV